MKQIARCGLVMALVSFALVSVYAADSTPAKLSLFPKLTVPQQNVVHGLDLGIVASNVDEVQGVQLAWIFGGINTKTIGLQTAFVAKSTMVTGVQWGFYNGANDVTGVQLGFINITERMKGVQVGLVNIIKQGVVPAMVLVNANF